MADFILVGADPAKADIRHPGGVLTLSMGLVDHARALGHSIEVIDVARPGFARVSLKSRALSGARHVLELVRALARHRRDGVIIFSGAGFSFYERILMSLACKVWRVNDLFVIVDGNFLTVEGGSGFRKAVTCWLLKVPHKLAASGQPWMEFFRRLGVSSTSLEKIHYWLPNSFVPAAVPKKLVSGKPIHFLFMGWLTKAKGIEEIITAIDALYDASDFRFTMVGGGTLLEDVRAVIANRGWQQRVSVPGWVTDTQLRSLMYEADVFVLPSHAEGFPMSLIEALYMGMPAIVSDVGGVSDSLRDGVNGFLIAPKDAQSLVTAMRKYIEQPDLIPLHSKASMAIARENHDAAKNCALYFQALQTAK